MNEIKEEAEVSFHIYDFEPVEDKPGYVWFSKRNAQIISVETLQKLLEDKLSQIKEGDVIYDESGEIVYYVIKVYKSGILTDWRWVNSCGRHIENEFLTYEELLCKDMMFIRGDNK